MSEGGEQSSTEEQHEKYQCPIEDAYGLSLLYHSRLFIPINPSINQSIKLFIHQPTPILSHQSIKLLIHQPINQSID